MKNSKKWTRQGETLFSGYRFALPRLLFAREEGLGGIAGGIARGIRGWEENTKFKIDSLGIVWYLYFRDYLALDSTLGIRLGHFR
ncbi:MAG: hypothetical protein NTX85_03070 [Candidatus Nomurabacteria bacterium]|nr:hypothetical protein [Candidatus Nomurabacteria bacterium]